MKKLPVSVVCPVRNCIHSLPAHATHLCALAEVVEELIIVDSDSTDGTFEYLKNALAAYGAHFFNHPPGLYQSWNYGIANATQAYCTIATVGDPLPVHSLQKLVATIEKLSADIVISAPLMIGDNGERLPKRWAIHDIIAAAKISQPQIMTKAVWTALTFGFFPDTLISSSAGNLYLTQFLQKNPFPTEFGHGGDSLWALQMSSKARWAIDPQVESYFWVHETTANHRKATESEFYNYISEAKEIYTNSESFLKEEIPAEYLEIIKPAPEQLLQRLLMRAEYTKIRNPSWPSFLQPKAALLKRKRRSLNKTIEERRDKTLAFAKSLAVVSPTDVRTNI
jgi:glycosyltransferase involved in cell wall biosynthesis